MRVLVQEIETRMFLGKAGDWVKDAAGARDFRRVADAITHCVLDCLTDIRIGLFSGDPKFDVYFYPFKARDEVLKTRKLRKENRALRFKQCLLKAEVKALTGEIAQQSATLPMRRKKKRQKPPMDAD